MRFLNQVLIILISSVISISCSNIDLPIVDWNDLKIQNLSDPEYWKNPMFSDKVKALNGKKVIVDGSLFDMPNVNLQILVDTTAQIIGGPCGFFSSEDMIELVYTNDSLKLDLKNKSIERLSGEFKVLNRNSVFVYQLVDSQIIPKD